MGRRRELIGPLYMVKVSAKELKSACLRAASMSSGLKDKVCSMLLPINSPPRKVEGKLWLYSVVHLLLLAEVKVTPTCHSPFPGKHQK
jgi:hypothetical protein